MLSEVRHVYVVVCPNSDHCDIPVAACGSPERAEREQKAFAEREAENPYWQTEWLRTYELPILE